MFEPTSLLNTHAITDKFPYLNGFSDSSLTHVFYKGKKINFASAESNWSDLKLDGEEIVILLVPNFTPDQIAFLNQARGRYLVNSKEKLIGVVAAIQSRIDLEVLQEKARLEISTSNRKLEQLDRSLREADIERNSDLKMIRQEEQIREGRLNSLIQLVSALGGADAVEDYTSLLYQSLTGFQGFAGVHVIVSDEKDNSTLFTHQRTGSIKKGIAKTIEWSEGKTSLRHVLARELNRPVARVVTFDLGLGTVCIEHLLNGPQAQIFSKYLESYRHVLELSFQRVLQYERLQKVAKEWEKTFQDLMEPTAVIDRNFNVERSNKMMGKCFSFFGRSSPCDNCPLTQTFETKKRSEAKVATGGRVFSVQSFPIHLKSSGVAGELGDGAPSSNRVVHFYHDITERTRLQGELIQSEKMAALGNLASHVAHELNNPLTGLLGLAQVIQAETQDSQLKDDMSEVVSAVERSQKIISNLVEFSNRNSDLKKAELNWYELVNRTLTFLKSSLRNCSVDLALVESSPTFKCESQLMQQVIFNILQNSIQAMDKPGVIKIYDQIDGNFSRLVIEDNGPGIPNTLQGRIFDSFFTTKSDSGGTGLGLSLCKQILEMHGGRIFYDGEYKLGARFVLELPNGAK